MEVELPSGDTATVAGTVVAGCRGLGKSAGIALYEEHGDLHRWHVLGEEIGSRKGPRTLDVPPAQNKTKDSPGARLGPGESRGLFESEEGR